jgi:hypothetical protein
VFCWHGEIAKEILMIYSQLLAYFQSKHRLSYYAIAIAGCYLMLVSSQAQAQTRSISTTNNDSFDPISTQYLGTVSPNKNCDRPLQLNSSQIATTEIGREAQICTQTSARDRYQLTESQALSEFDRVAQIPSVVTIPLTQPMPLSPSLSSLLPQGKYLPLNSILTSEPILAPNNTPAIPLIAAPKPILSQDAHYIIPPQAVDPQLVDPFSTQFILNGDKISHLTPTVVKTGFESGNFRTSDLNFNIYQVIKADNIQSVTTDSVVRVNSRIESVGVRSVAQNRDITTTTSKPQTLLGVRQQVSLTANCQDNSGQTCTYLPGITIDESTIDPRTLQPTSVKITSQYGDVISPASVAAIAQPGFQSGTNGEQFGIDLYLPALGLVATSWSKNSPATGMRREDIQTAIAVNYTKMNRDFATNGVESTLSQTIRSINYINGDRHQLQSLVVQALGQVLPEAQIGIAPGTPGARIVVNPNLYRVANALRIPDNSQTIYQAGTSVALSRGKDPNSLPGAKSQAIWIGLSPVIERKFTNNYYYVTRTSPEIVSSGGGEGGIPVAVNLNNLGFNSGNLPNPYSQAYVAVYNQNVDRFDIETQNQHTDYYPHLSFTGVNMSENSLWRYYTGAIAPIGSQSPIKAYVGTDYAIATKQGLSISLGGISYLNPDPEYATQFFANAIQSIRLGENPRHSLTIGANANYIVNGTITIESIPVRSTQSYVNAGVTIELGDVSIGGTQFFGNLLPESTESKTIFNVGWKITEGLNVGAFYTAADRNISTNPYGVSLSLALNPNSNSLLYLGWNVAQIDFQRTLGPNANAYRDNTFTASVRLAL